MNRRVSIGIEGERLTVAVDAVPYLPAGERVDIAPHTSTTRRLVEIVSLPENTFAPGPVLLAMRDKAHRAFLQAVADDAPPMAVSLLADVSRAMQAALDAWNSRTPTTQP